MKKTMLKLGVLALTLVMLLGCFAACGGGSEADSATDPNMKVKNFNGTTFKYPSDFIVTKNYGDDFFASSPNLNEMIEADTSIMQITKDQYMDIVKESGSIFQKTENLEIIDDFTTKSQYETDGIFYTQYTQIVFEENNEFVRRNDITITETSPDYILAQKVFG